MPGFASLLAVSAAAAVRVASLNLCSDEALLSLARPDEIASLSYLSRDPRESVMWRQAQRFPANRGSLEDALATRPTVVLTMGGGGRATALIARRLGLRVIDLPFAVSIDDIDHQLSTVATALGDPHRADPLRARLRTLRASAPTQPTEAAFISGGGQSIAPDGLGAEWLRLAGFAQVALPGDRLTFETLATDPPKHLIRSDYRSNQMSRGVTWWKHPLVTRLAARTIRTDGRAWTCAGAPMIDEIERLRAAPR